MAHGFDHLEGSDGYDEEGSVALPAFLLDPLGIVRRRWLWMLLVLAIGVGGTYGFAATREPRYVAETRVLVSSQVIPSDFVRTTVQDDSLSHINAIVGQVLSRVNLSGLIEKYGLYPELRDRVPLASLIDEMRDRIEIHPSESLRQNSSSQVYAITFEYSDPEAAAQVTNELGAFFTEANMEMRNRQAQLTTDFLRRELQRSERELREQEHRVTEYQQLHQGSLPAELQANIARLDRLQQESQSLAAQIDAAEDRLMTLTSAPEDEIAAAGTPEALLAELRARLEQQLVILTEEHPNVIALRRRIERLEAEIGKDGSASPAQRDRRRRIEEEQRGIAQLRSRLAEITERIGTLDEYVENTPKRQEELAALEQRAGVLRDTYLEFLRKVQEAELAQNLESAQHGARISVLDRASPPSSPKLAQWKILTGGVVGSLALALGLGILLELLDSVVVDTGQLESLVDKPLLGSVPRIA